MNILSLKNKAICFYQHLQTDNLTLNRSFLLGVAILSVLIYHFFCWTINPFGRFNIGYVGVDIFLFLSGWGLTHSYTKNNLQTFYLRRIKKIVPLYLLTSIIIICISANSEWGGVIEALKRISTISYYTDPDHSIDWYLNSLFIFYLTFPILYKICNKLKFKAVILFTVIVLTIYYISWYYQIPIHWKHDCFLARIPIFCAGIVYATAQYSQRQILSTTGICLLLYLPFYYASAFLAASALVFAIALCSIQLSPDNLGRIYHKIEYLGKYTLELYCANIILHKIFMNISLVNSSLLLLLIKILAYIPLQFILSYALIKINQHFQK